MEDKFVVLLLFFGSLIFDLIFVFKEVKKSRFFSKTLLMPLLLLFYILSTNKIIFSLIFALIFSFFGDLFLLFENKKIFFILGLFSFLIAHFFYLLTFLITSNFFIGKPFYIYFLLIPYLSFGIYFFNYLKPEIKKYKTFIFIYILLILLMSFATIPRYFTVSFNKFIFPFVGSILFIISDSLLSLRKFKKTIKENNVLVMLLYAFSQLFIILGFI